jgi:hypothetical protein
MNRVVLWYMVAMSDYGSDDESTFVPLDEPVNIAAMQHVQRLAKNRVKELNLEAQLEVAAQVGWWGGCMDSRVRFQPWCQGSLWRLLHT